VAFATHIRHIVPWAEGKQGWRRHRPVAACTGQHLGADRPGAACAAFLRDNPKAALQWRHEADLRRFEQRYTFSPTSSQ
jgi:adenosine deaminase